MGDSKKKRELRKELGPKVVEVRGDWRRLHNEKLHELYLSPNIRMVKSRRMWWTGHVARVGDERVA